MVTGEERERPRGKPVASRSVSRRLVAMNVTIPWTSQGHFPTTEAVLFEKAEHLHSLTRILTLSQAVAMKQKMFVEGELMGLASDGVGFSLGSSQSQQRIEEPLRHTVNHMPKTQPRTIDALSN